MLNRQAIKAVCPQSFFKIPINCPQLKIQEHVIRKTKKCEFAADEWIRLIYQAKEIDPTCFWFLFDLILYISVNNFSVMSGLGFLGWTSTKQGSSSVLVLPKDTTHWRRWDLNLQHPWSWVKHSTTEPLPSQIPHDNYLLMKWFQLSRPRHPLDEVTQQKWFFKKTYQNFSIGPDKEILFA